MNEDWGYLLLGLGIVLIVLFAMAWEFDDCKKRGGQEVVIYVIPVIQNMGNGMMFINQIPIQECRFSK